MDNKSLFEKGKAMLLDMMGDDTISTLVNGLTAFELDEANMKCEKHYVDQLKNLTMAVKYLKEIDGISNDFADININIITESEAQKTIMSDNFSDIGLDSEDNKHFLEAEAQNYDDILFKESKDAIINDAPRLAETFDKLKKL